MANLFREGSLPAPLTLLITGSSGVVKKSLIRGSAHELGYPVMRLTVADGIVQLASNTGASERLREFIPRSRSPSSTGMSSPNLASLTMRGFWPGSGNCFRGGATTSVARSAKNRGRHGRRHGRGHGFSSWGQARVVVKIPGAGFPRNRCTPRCGQRHSRPPVRRHGCPDTGQPVSHRTTTSWTDTQTRGEPAHRYRAACREHPVGGFWTSRRPSTAPHRGTP